MAAILTLATTLPTAAMTQKEASENLMYFAFAMKQGELCEGKGFPGMALLQRWEKKNGDVLVKSLRRIEDHAAADSRVGPEQAKDVALGLFVRYKERFDRELAPAMTSKSCEQFGQTLKRYEQRLVSP